MKQPTDLSTLVAGMVSEVVAGVITGIASARRTYYRNLFLAAIVAAGITLAIAYRDRLPSVSVTFPRDTISTPTPEKGRKLFPSPEPSPSSNNDMEELRRLTRPNPL